tara:strand:- start:180 stop:707 length:528 start_codon:yes stop_codon:yes gene_type:complete
MAKWKEVDIYTGLVVDEDAPTNATGTAVAGTGDDSSVVVVKKKKKKGLYDGRTKEYHNHRSRLERAREKRETLKLKRENKGFTGKTVTRLSQFSRESYLQEDNIQALKDIVKSKSAKSLKFQDGKMKVDMFTASAIVQVYDAVKDANKKKMEDMLNGKKAQFMKMADFAMKQVKK